MKNYIEISIVEKYNNYKLLVATTESFRQFMYFLEYERGYKKMKIKIGDFEYDDWKANIYCILKDNKVYFEHVRDYDKKSWKNKTLTEQLIYAWDFENIKFNINFNIINEFWNLLNRKDKNTYDEIIDEVHSELW